MPRAEKSKLNANAVSGKTNSFCRICERIRKENKIIWSSIWAIMIVGMTALLAGIFIAAFLISEGVWQLVTIIGVCVVFLVLCFYALKLEVSVGAYKSQNCGHEIVPTYKETMMAMHRGFTRHLMCPKCNSSNRSHAARNAFMLFD